ncbi:unnamed protein product [Trichobilharzia szidati]|nr:unnamed protein product [Trichobilharzia szidati]
MRSADCDVLLTKVKGYDYVLLDSAAFEKFGSAILCSGANNVLSINEVGEEVYNKSFVFVVSSPFTKYMLDKITLVMCNGGKPKGCLVLSTVEAIGNCGLFNLSEAEEYPLHEVEFLSQEEKHVSFTVEFVPSSLRAILINLHVLPASHALLPGLKDFRATFYDINSLLWSLKAVEEVYSFGQNSGKIASQFADFHAAVNRRRNLYNGADKRSASVIFIDELAICDPIACLEPYTRPNHLLDLLFAELSPDGHRANVSWQQMSICPPFENKSNGTKTSPEQLYTDLMLSMDSNTNLLLDEHLMLKEHASLSKIQQNLLFVAELINHDLPELSEPPRTKLKWADLLRSQVKELFVPICKSGRFELLNHIQMALAVINAFDSVTSRNRSHNIHDSVIGLDKLLVKYERSLLVASHTDAKLIQQLQKPTHFEPILLNAYKEAMNLPNLDEMFLFVTHTINLMPVHASVSDSVWSAVREMFTLGRTKSNESSVNQRVPGGLIPKGLSVNNLIENIKSFREKRAQLPSYNNLVGTSQARYQSPLLQMMKDLVAARENPSEANPALNGLLHKPSSSSSGNWLGELSRFIRIPGGGGSDKFPPYKADYIILVLMGSLSFSLCRDLFEIVTSHSINKLNHMFKVSQIIGMC